MTIKFRFKHLCWLLGAIMFVLSGIPYVSYLYVRNKVLAHHGLAHPDDVILVGWMGAIPHIHNGLNLAIWLDNPGGTVYMPNGSYSVTNLTLKSNLNLIGAGRGQADAGACPTTITTTSTTGDTLAITNMTDMHLSDFCLVNTGAGSTGAAIRLNYGQRVTVERLYIFGPWAVGIGLKTSNTSGASTIWNHFTDIHITGLAAAGIGCLLDSSDASTKVIDNNYFFNTSCIGGNGGVGLKLTNSGVHNQIINDNEIHSGELSCTANTGTGVLIDQGSTVDLSLYNPNIEGCTIGFSKRTANNVSIYGGKNASNGANSLAENVVDDQPTFTSWYNTSIGSATMDLSISPLGDLRSNGIGIKAPPDPGNFNMLNGAVFEASGTSYLKGNNTGPQFMKPTQFLNQAAPTCAASSGWIWEDSTANVFEGCDQNGTPFVFSHTTASQIWNVGCSGVAAAGTTIVMPWLGAATGACTNTSTVTQAPMPAAGTAVNMRVRCSAGGVNGSSGAFTLQKNGGATALTCTTGAATTCSDTTHTVALAGGDALLVQFTTQGGETLANCSVSFNVQ